MPMPVVTAGFRLPSLTGFERGTSDVELRIDMSVVPGVVPLSRGPRRLRHHHPSVDRGFLMVGWLVVRFRSSSALAARSDTNFGIHGPLAILRFLVPLLNPKFAIAFAARARELRVRGTSRSSRPPAGRRRTEQSYQQNTAAAGGRPARRVNAPPLASRAGQAAAAPRHR